MEIINKNKGVCVVSTPYRWEWMEKNEKQYISKLKKFTRNSTCKLFRIGKKESENKLKEILGEENANKYLEKCCWKYEFEEHFLKETLDIVIEVEPLPQNRIEPYKTYIPYVFLEFKDPLDKISLDEILWVGFEHSYLDAFNNLLHYTEDVAKDLKHLFVSMGLGIVTIAIPLMLIFAAYQMHKSKSSKYDDVKKSFGNLQYLTYPQIEKLEREMRIPPLTLAVNKQIFGLKINEWEKIEDLMSHHSELVKLTEKLGKWEECIVLLEQLEKININLKDTVRIGDIINENILKSIEHDLVKVYDPLNDLKNWNPPIIPEDFTIKIVGRDELADSIIAKIKNGKRLIIVKGPGGIGKTTLAIYLAEKLKKEHYFIGVPIPEYFSFLEYRLMGAAYGSNGIVLFSEYKIAPTKIDEILIRALKLLDVGAYNSLVIVCRDEVYQSLEEQIYTQTGSFGGESTAIRKIFYEREDIQVPPLNVEDIVGQLWKDETIMQNMDAIKKISERNPLYAILVADWVISGNSLTGVTKHSFLTKYVTEKILPNILPEVQDS